MKLSTILLPIAVFAKGDAEANQDDLPQKCRRQLSKAKNFVKQVKPWAAGAEALAEEMLFEEQCYPTNEEYRNHARALTDISHWANNL